VPREPGRVGQQRREALDPPVHDDVVDLDVAIEAQSIKSESFADRSATQRVKSMDGTLSLLYSYLSTWIINPAPQRGSCRMTLTRLRRRLLSVLTLSTLAIGGASIVVTGAALAASNVLHPTGCSQITRNSWSSSCWVGYHYVSLSVSVLAVQYVLKDTGHSPGTPDCDFGPNTDNATIAY
jgi:hypothetical protein